VTLSDVRPLELRSSDADVALQMDEETFRAFYERTARPLWAYLSRIVGDRQLADDLLQESYYRFLRASASFENEAHRRNSLFRIATNLARDAHRRARLRPWLNNRGTQDPDSIQQPGAAGRIDQRADLDRAMRGLKPRERAILWLAYVEGSSHREIANTVGVQMGSVRLMLFRARRKLSNLLNGTPSSGRTSGGGA
jgi:RNA polymerase sigma-70 factor (ECF subfamily)